MTVESARFAEVLPRGQLATGFWPAVMGWMERQAAPAAALATAGAALLLAALSLGTNTLDGLVMPLFLAISISEILLLVHAFRVRGWVDAPLVMIVGLTLVALSIVGGLPDYFAVPGQSAIFHRSAVSIVALGVVGVPLLSSALYYARGATPSAEDLARYPFVVLPAAALLGTYALLLGALLARGVPQLNWDLVTGSFQLASASSTVRAGLATHLLGTGLLVLLTNLISLPIGVATGVALSEYAPPRLAAVIRFCCTSLRGISVLLLGLTAVSLIEITRGTPLGALLAGHISDQQGNLIVAGGSFIVASLITSLLVIPVIARATEEGCRSVPEGLRDGSLALGATEQYGLWRILLPWAFPNIITGLLIGSAEAAGGVATLLFIAGIGVAGAGILNPVTSLSYAVFATNYSSIVAFRRAMEPHREGAAVLLLLVALIFTAAGLLLKHRYATRYRA